MKQDTVRPVITRMDLDYCTLLLHVNIDQTQKKYQFSAPLNFEDEGWPTVI